jgi:hypothetical protein
VWIVFAALLLVPLLGCESRRDASVDTRQENSSRAIEPPPPPVPNPMDSPRIQKFLKRAQSRSRGPIKVEPIPYGSGASQAYTRPLGDGSGSGGWDIHHMVGPSSDYNEALLAHELRHVILINNGFPGVMFRLKKSLDSDSDRALYFIGKQMGPDCFPDELIDRESVKEGFKPNLLLERQMELTEQGVAQFSVGEFQDSPKLNKEFEAVKLFCLGKRVLPKTMRSFEGRVERTYGPTIMDRERNLAREFQGQRCRIDDPTGCFKLVLKLRKAMGMEDFISFFNPKTKKWE